MVSGLDDKNVSLRPDAGLPLTRDLDGVGLGDRDGVHTILGFLGTCPEVENSERFFAWAENVIWLGSFPLLALSRGGCTFLELVTGVRIPYCRISDVLLGVAGSEDEESGSFI